MQQQSLFDLKKLFSIVGPVSYVKTVMKKKTRGLEGDGFENSYCSKKALERLNGLEVAGRTMKKDRLTDRTAIFP
ncbi:hypothetical protein JTE90_009162 [Oedothorax gibbosus]|uniref:RRM domain-containing protein n=1 Tax=Oedothorax gibbosus TaxID=931172 RepID=A0AAV6TTW2_9ARAC|nr:hypothetical protein JTE90_009162 [Oedothorax gibbosus]